MISLISNHLFLHFISFFMIDFGFSNDMMSYAIAILSFITLFFLFIGSIAAGAEIAFFTLSSKDINYFKIRPDNASGQIVNLTEKPFALKYTLRSTKVLSSIIITACTFIIAMTLLEDLIPNLYTILVIVLICNILLQLLIMECIPKIYARQNKIRMALFSVSFVSIFFHLLKNFVSKKRYDDILNKKETGNALTPKEFEEAVRLKLGHEPSKEELDMFRGIMKFGQITVKQVMEPRRDISSIREEWNIEEVRRKILKSRFSRMPVYRSTIDNITGILFSKDLLELDEKKESDWHTLIRPALYVHETKLIEDLFQEFQTKRVHMAIVVDEYGGTSGLVTLENIMEQVVGEIRDEYEVEVLNYKKIDDNNFIFEGKTHINVMCRVLGVEYDTFNKYKGQSTSINGLLLEVSKKFPAKDDVIQIENFTFEILETVKHQIERVKVTKL